MRLLLRPCALVALLSFMCIVSAGPPKKMPNQPKAERGETVESHGITWHRDLDKALELARGNGSDKERPVLLLRVLGDLDGFM